MDNVENVELPKQEDKKEEEPTTPAKLSAIQRIIGTLLFPAEVFMDINLEPTVFLPIILSIVISLGSSIVILQKLHVNWEQLYSKAFDQQLEKQGKSRADLSPKEKEQIDEQIKTMAKVAPYISYISPIVFPIAVPIILALIFWGGTSLMGGITTFKKVHSLVMHVFCVVSLGVQMLLNVTVVFIKNPADIDLTKGTFITSNLGALLPAGSPKMLVATLTQMDLFTIWPLILIAIGLPAIAKNFPKQYAVITVFGLWAIYATVAVLLKVIFG
jgi:hypothetical protein